MAKKNGSKSPMDAALDYLSAKARTVREVENKLDSLSYGEYEVEQVIVRLKELNYLNDYKYASDFVESRLRTKPVSRKKLKEQLFLHFLPKDAIAEALEQVDDAIELQNTLSAAEILMPRFSQLETEEAKRRMAQRLAARGFGYETVKPVIERLYGDAEGTEAAFLEGEAQSEDEA